MKLDRRWWLIGILPLATGAALLVHVATGISMGLALVSAAIIVAGSATLAWRHMSPWVRREVLARVRVGLFAGLLGTIAYDGVRWVTVSLFHDVFSPFEMMPVFGRAIMGSNLPYPWLVTVGWIYHYTNGLMFAVAYTLLLGSRSPWLGVLWALGLEALMLTIYPGWVHPHPYAEFLRVSMVGHVAYGTVIGFVSNSGLKRLHRARRSHVDLGTSSDRVM